LGHDLPGQSYKSLSRNVNFAWHVAEKVNKTGESKISETYFGYLKNQSKWVSDWRSMFTLSDVQIKRNLIEAYANIVDTIASGDCGSINCNMEVYFHHSLDAIPFSIMPSLTAPWESTQTYRMLFLKKTT
jgi:hypothetical protein